MALSYVGRGEVVWGKSPLCGFATVPVRINETPPTLVIWTQNTPNTMKAIWNRQTIAESDNTVVVENNHYFPADSLKREFLTDSTTHTTCPWKGVASYYSLTVDGKTNPDAAWYYPEPKAAASQINGHVAFWKGVQVVK